MDFLTQLRLGAERCSLRGETVLVAVSGGADSVALLHGLLALREDMHWQLTAAHFNHRLRGADSEADAVWVRSYCERLEVPIVVGEIPPQTPLPASGLEEAARDARYRFLRQTALATGSRSIAVAHTADDQTETVLHHILRGTGVSGLRGMTAVRDLPDGLRLVRPMLDITRQSVLDYLADLGQEFRCDASNRDLSQTRNRLRHVLLPLLRAEFNPRVDEALRRLARQAEELEATLHQLAEELLKQALIEEGPSICRMSCDVLSRQPRQMVRECFVLLWKRLGWPRQRMGFAEWNRLAEVVQQGGTITLPDRIEARRRGNLLIVRHLAPDDSPGARANCGTV